MFQLSIPAYQTTLKLSGLKPTILFAYSPTIRARFSWVVLLVSSLVVHQWMYGDRALAWDWAELRPWENWTSLHMVMNFFSPFECPPYEFATCVLSSKTTGLLGLTAFSRTQSWKLPDFCKALARNFYL